MKLEHFGLLVKQISLLCCFMMGFLNVVRLLVVCRLRPWRKRERERKREFGDGKACNIIAPLKQTIEGAMLRTLRVRANKAVHQLEPEETALLPEMAWTHSVLPLLDQEVHWDDVFYKRDAAGSSHTNIFNATYVTCNESTGKWRFKEPQPRVSSTTFFMLPLNSCFSNAYMTMQFSSALSKPEVH